METGRKGGIIKAPSYLVWGLPLLFCIPIIIMLVNDTNIDVFFTINSFSKITGDRIWALLTMFADGLIVFVFLAPVIRKKPRLIWAVIFAGILYLVIGSSMKRILDVPRPPQVIAAEHFHLIGPAWLMHSFPSGHATMAFILTGAFALTASRVWVRGLMIVLGSLMALSRVAVGVHWPIDILAGAILGWLSIWLALKFSERMTWTGSAVGQKIIGASLLICCISALFWYSSSYHLVDLEQRIIAALFLCLGLWEYLKLYGISPKKRNH